MTTRRGFVQQVAAAACIGVTPAAAAADTCDPIFAAIAVHREAWKVLGDALLVADRSPAPEFQVGGRRIRCTDEGEIASARRVLEERAIKHDIDLDENHGGARAVIAIALAFLAAEKGVDLYDAAQVKVEYEKSCAELTAHLEAEAGVDAAHDVINQAQSDLITTVPTTFAGAVAVIRYVTACHEGGDYILDEEDVLTFIDMIGDVIEAGVAV
jgi:hypothetical protein